MYRNKDNGLIEYETFDELLNADIVEMNEDKDNYYIYIKSEDYYDSSIWVVNKETEEISFILYPEYLCIVDDLTAVNPKTIKRTS